MAEIIVTLEDVGREPLVRIHPWLYELSNDDPGPLPLRVKLYQGLSPVRHALLSGGMLPEQDLSSWEKISLDRIRIGDSVASPSLDPAPSVDALTREKTLSQLARALQTASGSPIEQHATAFGCIVVAKLAEPHYLAFALGSEWPMPVLEVHRLNRDAGSTEPTQTPAGLSAADIRLLLEIYRAAKATHKGARHVEC
jgi:hypothetical protein